MRAAKLSTKQSDVPGTSHIPLPARSGRKVSSPFIPQFRPRRCSVTKTIGLSFGQGCSGLSDHSKHRRAYINSRRSPSADSTASDCNDQTTKKAGTGAHQGTRDPMPFLKPVKTVFRAFFEPVASKRATTCQRCAETNIRMRWKMEIHLGIGHTK